MFRLRAWGLSAAAVAGLATPALAADPPPTQTTLYNKLFGPAKPKPVGPVDRNSPAMSGRPATTTAPMAPEVLAAALRAEQEAWGRRMDVCLKLRQVGFETNNESLIRQADDLERQATALYNQRTAALGVPRVKSPLPDGGPAILDRQLGTGIAVTPLTAPAAPVPATATAELPREVKP